MSKIQHLVTFLIRLWYEPHLDLVCLFFVKQSPGILGTFKMNPCTDFKSDLIGLFPRK
jgi:hypothetical protein